MLAIQHHSELKSRKRQAVDSWVTSRRNKVVARFGPVVVGDARLHVAADEHGRVATRQQYLVRQLKKDLASEQRAFRRWLVYYKGTQTEWIKGERICLRLTGQTPRQVRDILLPHRQELTDTTALVERYLRLRQDR